MSIQHVYDTAANLTSNNPTLAAGEWGIESDTGLTKIGDGTTAWTSLSYWPVEDHLFLPASAMYGHSGSGISFDTFATRMGAWVLDDATYSRVMGGIVFPYHWKTADVSLHWSSTATTGSARLGVHLWYSDDGDNLDRVADANLDQSLAAPATTEYLNVDSFFTTGALTPAAGKSTQVAVIRDGTGIGGTDDMTAGAAIVGVEFVKAS